jgi:hypothetical protein
MRSNDPEEKERIARDLGWPSYDDAPPVVQNNIDAKIQDRPLSSRIEMRKLDQ